MSSNDDRFVALYRRHYREVLRYAQRRVDPETARDVTAETFLVALRRLEAIPAEPLPWLYGVARKTLANADRAQRRSQRLDARLGAEAASRPPVTEEVADRIGEREAVGQALANLSTRDRELVRLIAWEGLEVREAAQVLECTPAAAAVRLHRIRRRLTHTLEAASTLRLDRLPPCPAVPPEVTP